MHSGPILITNNAIVNIYLIGYKHQGESIVIEINDDLLKKPICGIIDCFKSNNLNKTLEILKEKNIDELRFVFWSHPDNDHSFGLEEILEKFNKNILIVGVSEGISCKEIISSINNEDTNSADYMKKIFRNLAEISRKIEDGFISINHATRRLNIDFCLKNGEKRLFSIEPIAPFSHKCREESIKLFTHIINNDKQSEIRKNKISTGFIFSIGEYKACFTGDMINESLPKGKSAERFRNKLKSIDVLKIPHHGGMSSDKFIGFLPKSFELAGVTRYNDTNPSPEIIKRYKNKTRVYSTSDINMQNNNNQYGIIKVTIPFDNTKEIQTKLIGNACEL